MMGVNLDRIILYTFLIGGLMAGVAATLYDLHYHQTQYSVGQLPGSEGLHGGRPRRYRQPTGRPARRPPHRACWSSTGRASSVPSGATRSCSSSWSWSCCSGPTGLLGESLPGPGYESAPGGTAVQELRRVKNRLIDRAGRDLARAQPWWSKTLAVVVLLSRALAIVLPSNAVARIMAPQSSWPNVLSEDIGVFILLAIGLNVVVGQAGMLDLGYVAFYAVGGYALALARHPAPLELLGHPAGRHRHRGPVRADPRGAHLCGFAATTWPS